MKPAISLTPLTPMLLADHVNNLGNGTWTISMADGTVISIQPGGVIGYRPTGTAGPYEVCVLSGPFAIYNPAGTPYTYSYVAGVPNS